MTIFTGNRPLEFDRAAFDDLLRRAREKFDGMTPEQQEDMLRQPWESFVRGEIGMGTDADEAAYAAVLRGAAAAAAAAVKRLEAESAERVRRFDERRQK